MNTKPFSIRVLKNALHVCVIECFQPEKTADAFSADISLFSSGQETVLHTFSNGAD